MNDPRNKYIFRYLLKISLYYHVKHISIALPLINDKAVNSTIILKSFTNT